MEEFITIKKDEKAEITIKKSKFIAEVYYIENVKQAEEKIQEIEKREHSAKHHCYAYRVLEESLVQKMSDDGEPSGTAGSPMLSILQGRNLVNVLVVVTRYFGGILLGTGGLVKAYSDSTIEALNNAGIQKKQKGVEIFVEIDYTHLEQIKYYIKQIGGNIKKAEYEKTIKLMVEIPKDKLEEITNNYNNFSFKIQKMEIVNEKYIDI